MVIGTIKGRHVMLSHRLLELDFSQIANAWKKARHNQYSNNRKRSYHKKLGFLFDKLKDVDFAMLGETERKEYKEIMRFFSLSLEYLNHSTMNTVPYELIYCLRCALKDWNSNSEHYVIVTSSGDYCFSYTLSLSKCVYDIIRTKLGIDFDDKLIQICLPQNMERDYLCNAVLYHELGHFVDLSFGFSKLVFSELQTHFSETEVKSFFPFLDDMSIPNDWKNIMVLNHLQEYFADLFASQYIGKAAYYYLDYIAGEYSMSNTHPSTQNRIALVNKFLSDSSSHLLFRIFRKFAQLVFHQEFKPKYLALANSDDFYRLIPCELTDKNQLHTLFPYAWDIWLNNKDEFERYNSMSDPLKPVQKYMVLNNLIEKSINNYIVKEKWEKMS